MGDEEGRRCRGAEEEVGYGIVWRGWLDMLVEIGGGDLVAVP